MIGSSDGKAYEDGMDHLMDQPVQIAAGKDLDKRTPEPLPILPPVHSIAPHNPNPPGGGGYEIRPGERLSSAESTTQLASNETQKKPVLTLGEEQAPTSSNPHDKVQWYLTQGLRALGIGPGADVLSMINDLARHYGGDLLFPVERTTRNKERRQEYINSKMKELKANQ